MNITAPPRYPTPINGSSNGVNNNNNNVPSRPSSAAPGSQQQQVKQFVNMNASETTNNNNISIIDNSSLINRPASSTSRPHDQQSSSSTSKLSSNAETILLLVFSAFKNDLDKVKSIINTGVSPDVSDYDNRTPLHVASAEGHIAVVKALVEAGADVNKVDRWGNTALDDARNGGDKAKAVLEYLSQLNGIKSGEELGTASLKRKNQSEGLNGGKGLNHANSSSYSSGVKWRVLDPVSPVASFLQNAADGNLEALKAILNDGDGVNVNSCDYDKRTAAHLAACEGHIHILQFLQANGCNLLARDRWGHSPYNDAIRSNKTECAEFLREQGASDESTHMLKDSSIEEFEKLHARGISEKWAINVDDFKMGDKPFARGAGGELYKIKWRGLQCVAKSCANMRGDNAQIATDLGNEISVMATLRHPFLVMFLGACFQVRPPILLMEFCEGGTLEEKLLHSRVEDRYILPLQMRYRFIHELAIGMCFLHGCNPPIVHRDLKPSNVLLTADLHIKVTDFGLSKFIPSKNKTMGDKFMMTGETGSYRYMAPEVFNHEQYNAKVDVYSFALICYWIITGIRPFITISDPVEAVKKAAAEGLRPSLKFISNRPKTRRLIERCWAQDAKDRPTFVEIVEVVEGLKDEFTERSIFSCCMR